MRVMSFNLRSDFILDFKNRWDNRKHIVYDIIDKDTQKENMQWL